VTAPLIELRGVTRTYHVGDADVHALAGIDLIIRRGELVAIVGPSGSGKSTLMYLLGLLDQPTTGSYLLDGQEVAHLGDHELSQARNRGIGYVFQQYHLLAELTVNDNVGLGLVYGGVAPAIRAGIAARLTAALGLGHRTAHTARELSGGQQQRVAIARGLACSPRLILADEPTGNLDRRTGAEILTLFKQLHAQGHTVVVITHDLDVAHQCERVVRIIDGRITSDEPVAAASSSADSQAATPATQTADHGPDVRPLSSREGGSAEGAFVGDASRRRAPPTNSGVRLADLVRIAVSEGLYAHKLRSLLTMLGIIFGIAAVIAMTAITEGGKRRQLEQIRQIGMNNIQVRARDLDGLRLLRLRRLNPEGVSLSDLDAIRKHVPGIAATTAWKGVRAELRRGERLVDDAGVTGVTGDFETVANFHVEHGRFLAAEDEAASRRVCVLGAVIADRLGLDGSAALGQQVLVGDEPCTVIGVMRRRPFTTSDIADVAIVDRNREVYLPFATLRAFFRKEPRATWFDAISLRMDSDEQLLERSKLIHRIVGDLHQDADDFQVTVPLESLKQAQQTKEVFNVIIIVIAAISLIVGGIGIMNIMLASVTERTREIGVRRAVGASRRDIMRQFLAESLVLSLSGGVLGVGLGVGAGLGIQAAFGFAVAFSPLIMAIATVVSMAIGVGFGLYPAWLAARMNPVEALRS